MRSILLLFLGVPIPFIILIALFSHHLQRAMAILIGSLGFKWRVSAFADYQKTYGAIGGIIVALLWLYVSGLALLMDAEMNAVIDRLAVQNDHSIEAGRGGMARSR